MKVPQWIVCYGFAPEHHQDGTLESDDCSVFIGDEKEADDFFQEMLFDGSYPLLIKSQLIECAIKQGREEVVDQFDEGCS